jgi:hypothetical protein
MIQKNIIIVISLVDGKVISDLNKKVVNVNLIRELGQVAPFGLGPETVVDETVRKAIEIPADRITIELDNFDAITRALKEIAPKCKKLVPKLYKLHMYEEGGMLKAHRDTMHAPNHYATLTIGLATEYTGGDFIPNAKHLY